MDRCDCSGSFELDCRLFSATGRAKPFSLRLVHQECHTALKAPALREEEEEVPKPVKAEVVREQLFCPKCQWPLKADEVSRGVEIEVGLITLSEAELTTLKPEPIKSVVTEFTQLDSMLQSVGIDWRYYVFPRPAAIDVYARIWTLLTEAQLVAFVPLLVLKRKPYVGVLRPLIIPSVFFDQESRVLVLETLTDTDTTKDSASFRDYPRALPEISMAKVAQPIAAVQMNLRQLAPEWCVNPRRVRLKELVQAAVARSLK